MNRWKIIATKIGENRINETIAKNHAKEIAQAIMRNRSYGMEAKVQMGELETLPEGKGYKLTATIKVSEDKARTLEKALANFQKVLENATKTAERYKWKIVQEKQGNEQTEEELNDETTVVYRPPFVVPDLCDNVYSEFFSGIYEREPHIRLIHDAIKTFANTKGVIKPHTLLFGKPASAKTVLLERFKDWLDSTDGAIERMTFIDAPNLTKAGAEDFFIKGGENQTLSEVVCIEEIEKISNPDSLSVLLSILASGHIIKTNAKIGRKQQRVNCLIMATCNNPEALKAVHSGALFSRFACRWHCERPSPELMKRILIREITEIQGNEAWADKCIDLAAKIGIDDPREVIALLAGGERLMTGEYQADYMSATEPKKT